MPKQSGRAPKKRLTPAPSAPDATKRDKLFNNLYKSVKQFVQGKSYQPLSKKELMTRLCLQAEHAKTLDKILQDLRKENILILQKGRYLLVQEKETVYVGTIRMHPRGFGFVKLEDQNIVQEDVFIPKHLTQNAVDGDTVEVLINFQSHSEKGPEGKVVIVLTRGRTHIAGIIRSVSDTGEILAYVPILGTEQQVFVEPNEDIPLKEGDRVVMEVIQWGEKSTETRCRATHLLGHISDPSCDNKAAIEEFGLRSDFSHKVLEEAKAYGTRVSPAEIKKRHDLRDTECFTIDPTTAKDFDDALSLVHEKDGTYTLGVHIADVSHYVQPGTALDTEALRRCNSTYFPGYCLPMLPSVLSDNLCSLKPNVNRLTVSIVMKFDETGELLAHQIFRSVIKSAKRFSYEEAKEVLDGKKKNKHKSTLELMVKFCHLLKKKRYERGSLEFAMPDTIVLVDQQGAPYGTTVVEYDITHQLVEEFMLKANEMVATHLSSIGKNLTYRIHEEPAEENLKDFSIMANAFGFNLPEKPTPRDLQSLFDEAMPSSYGPYLATSYIRRMRFAKYSPDNVGHYGLGLTHYCHFTSPIRRYVDLVVHRIIFGDSDDRKKLELIAHDCSEQERISAKAENQVVLLKKLRLLQTIKAEQPLKEFTAVVTKVKNFGFFFEVLDYMLEGFLHVSELDDDYYIFDEATSLLHGRRQGRRFVCGEKITILLGDVDLVYLETKWHLVSENPRKESYKKENRPQRSRKHYK